jgi:hypothetical protein
MTVPPDRNLDCFAIEADAGRRLSDLAPLLAPGIQGAEREAAIANIRAEFKARYSDIIEELVGLEVARFEKTQVTQAVAIGTEIETAPVLVLPSDTDAMSGDPRTSQATHPATATGSQVDDGQTSTASASTTAPNVNWQQVSRWQERFDWAETRLGALPPAQENAAVRAATEILQAGHQSPPANLSGLPTRYDSLYEQMRTLIAYLWHTGAGDPAGATEISDRMREDFGTGRRYDGLGGAGVEALADIAPESDTGVLTPDAVAATADTDTQSTPNTVGAVSPALLGETQGHTPSTASTTWTEFVVRAEKSLGKQREEYVDANLLIASEIMLGRHELPPLAHDPSHDAALRRKVLTDIRTAIAYQLHLDRDEPESVAGSVELSETLREFYNTKAVDPFVVPGGSPFSWLKGKKKQSSAQEFSPSAVSNWYASPQGSSQAGPSTGFTTSPAQSYVANPYFASTPEDRARLASTWRSYPRYLPTARHLMSRNPQLRTIPEEDLASLIGYTGNSFFDDVNSALRYQDPESLRRYDAHIRTTVSALNRMPVYIGPVTRTIELYTASDLKRAAAKYRPGTVVRESSFVSTDATTRQVRPGNMHFTMHSAMGRRIDSISEYQGTEVEVLFPPGTDFRVTSNKRRNGEYFIDLVEVPAGAPSQSLSYPGTSTNAPTWAGSSSNPGYFPATATPQGYGYVQPNPAYPAYPAWPYREGKGQDAVAGLPAEPARTLQVAETGFAGIEVHWDPEVDPTFLSTVREQLGRLASKPVGAALLDGFADAGAGVDASAGSTRSSLKVAIQRIGAGTVIDADGPAFAGHAGNRTEVSDAGGVTVRYNPNVWETADGIRPPFIGLGHELIHAQRALDGLATGDHAVEEAQVVGFREYDGLPFTENAIRAEHGLALRRTYSGVVPKERDDSHLGAATTSGKDPVRASEGARLAPTGEASDAEQVPASTGTAEQTQLTPADPTSAFLDAPRLTAKPSPDMAEATDNGQAADKGKSVADVAEISEVSGDAGVAASAEPTDEAQARQDHQDAIGEYVRADAALEQARRLDRDGQGTSTGDLVAQAEQRLAEARERVSAAEARWAQLAGDERQQAPDQWSEFLSDSPTTASVPWTDGRGLHLDAEANAMVSELHSRAAARESLVTGQVLSTAWATSDVTPRELESRLRPEESLRKKFASVLADHPGVPADNLIVLLNDTLRYTLEIPAEHYSSTVGMFAKTFLERNFSIFNNLNSWRLGGKGLSVFWREPSGLLIETQFHTPESLRAKAETELITERLGLPELSEDEQTALLKQKFKISGAVKTPTGVAALSNLLKNSDALKNWTGEGLAPDIPQPTNKAQTTSVPVPVPAAPPAQATGVGWAQGTDEITEVPRGETPEVRADAVVEVEGTSPATATHQAFVAARDMSEPLEASLEDLAAIRYEEEADLFEDQLAQYLMTREDLNNEVGVMVRALWEHATQDPQTAGQVRAFGSAEIMLAGTVGNSVEALRQVAYSGNIRERAAFLFFGVSSGLISELLEEELVHPDEITLDHLNRTESEEWARFAQTVDEITSSPLTPKDQLLEIREAEKELLGYFHVSDVDPPLSDRERAVVGDSSVLLWRSAKSLFALPMSSTLHQRSQTSGGRVLAGTSDSAYGFLHTAALMNQKWGTNLDLGMLRTAFLATSVTYGDHTFHEVMSGAQYLLDDIPGHDPAWDYVDDWSRYRKLYPLSEEELREKVAWDGLFPDEHVLDLVGLLDTDSSGEQVPRSDEHYPQYDHESVSDSDLESLPESLEPVSVQLNEYVDGTGALLGRDWTPPAERTAPAGTWLRTDVVRITDAAGARARQAVGFSVDQRWAPWHGDGRPSPYLVVAQGNPGRITVGSADGRTKQLAPEEFAALVAEDPGLRKADPKVPVVLALSSGGAGGSRLARLISARTQRPVWAVDEPLSIQPSGDGTSRVLTRFRDGAEPVGEWTRSVAGLAPVDDGAAGRTELIDIRPLIVLGALGDGGGPAGRWSELESVKDIPENSISWDLWRDILDPSQTSARVVVFGDELTQKDLASVTHEIARAGESELAQKVQDYQKYTDLLEREMGIWRPEKLIWTGEDIQGLGTVLENRIAALELEVRGSTRSDLIADRTAKLKEAAAVTAKALDGFVVDAAQLGGMYKLRNTVVPNVAAAVNLVNTLEKSELKPGGAKPVSPETLRAVVNLVKAFRHHSAYKEITQATLWNGFAPDEHEQQIAFISDTSETNIEILRINTEHLLSREPFQELHRRLLSLPLRLKHATNNFYPIAESGFMSSLLDLHRRGTVSFASAFTTMQDYEIARNADFVFFRVEAGDGPMETRYGGTLLTFDFAEIERAGGWISLHDQIDPLNRENVRILRDADGKLLREVDSQEVAGEPIRGWTNRYHATNRERYVHFSEEIFHGAHAREGIALSVLREFEYLGQDYLEHVLSLDPTDTQSLWKIVARLYRPEVKLPPGPINLTNDPSPSAGYRPLSIQNEAGDNRYLPNGTVNTRVMAKVIPPTLEEEAVPLGASDASKTTSWPTEHYEYNPGDDDELLAELQGASASDGAQVGLEAKAKPGSGEAVPAAGRWAQLSAVDPMAARTLTELVIKQLNQWTMSGTAGAVPEKISKVYEDLPGWMARAYEQLNPVWDKEPLVRRATLLATWMVSGSFEPLRGGSRRQPTTGMFASQGMEVAQQSSEAGETAKAGPSRIAGTSTVQDTAGTSAVQEDGRSRPAPSQSTAEPEVRRDPVPKASTVSTAFLDAPRSAPAQSSTLVPGPVTAEEPSGEVTANNTAESGTETVPTPVAEDAQAVQTTPDDHNTPDVRTSPVAHNSQAVQTTPVRKVDQGVQTDPVLTMDQGVQTDPYPSGQADALKQLAQLMLRTDLESARAQLDQAQQGLSAAQVRQANGTATGPCDLAVAEALFSLAEKQFQSATNSYNAVAG